MGHFWLRWYNSMMAYSVPHRYLVFCLCASWSIFSVVGCVDDRPPVDTAVYLRPEVDIATAPAKQAVFEVFSIMNSDAPEIESKYDQALRTLFQRSDAFDALKEIYFESIGGCKYPRYYGWMSVFLLGEMGTDESLHFLSEVILSDYSYVESPHTHTSTYENCWATEEDEIVLRYTAVTRLTEWCQKGSKQADIEITRLIKEAKPIYQEYIALGLESYGIIDKYFYRLQAAGVKVP